jgi:hypothetical protein
MGRKGRIGINDTAYNGNSASPPTTRQDLLGRDGVGAGMDVSWSNCARSSQCEVNIDLLTGLLV